VDNVSSSTTASSWMLHRQLDRLCGRLAEPRESKPGQANEQRDATILTSLSRNDRIVLAAPLTVGWAALQRRDYHALRTLCGAAAVTKHSRKSRILTRPLACSPRFRPRTRALRSVGDRLLNVACPMLRNRTQFSPSRQSQNVC